MMNKLPHTIRSIEDPQVMEVKNVGKRNKVLRIKLAHKPLKPTEEVLDLTIELWSYNKPIMLVRHTTENVGKNPVQDVRLYNLMDFDIGGPESYKDDIGEYDPGTETLLVWDSSLLSAAIGSKPTPDRWEISSPVKLKVKNDRRDLTINLHLGPKDIATGLQWNLGDLNPGDRKSIDFILVSAASKNDIAGLLSEGWDLYHRKMQ